MAPLLDSPGLSDEQRSAIRQAVLESREQLETEIQRSLERLGIERSHRTPLDDLPHLTQADQHQRRHVEAAIDHYDRGETTATEAYETYVTEKVRRILNRLIGVKICEVRDLLVGTLDTQPEYGGRSYLQYTVGEIAGELTAGTADGLEPVLELAFQELEAELGSIFSRSRSRSIDIDPAVIRSVTNELHALEDEIWESDETIGWVYQYFGEEERSELDNRINDSDDDYRVHGADVGTKTQTFTPRHIVEWLVDNSLGRLWAEIHPDTVLSDEDYCFNLAPGSEGLQERPVRDVRDITILDPACGGGHMLVYAFDVLYQMYLEQGSVSESQIPRAILRHNLVGVDVDPGAAQLTALALYIKAKTQEPDTEIDRLNVVAADATLTNGDRRSELLSNVSTELERRVIEEVWDAFSRTRERGSLIRIEDRIEQVMEEEQEKLDDLRPPDEAKLTSEGIETDTEFIVGSEAYSWDRLKDHLLSVVDDLAMEALETSDPAAELVADEISTGLRLTEVFLGSYDVVVTNPPYLVSNKMGTELKEFVKANYKASRDLYSAFIERCLEFADDDGYVAMITMETFMYQYVFRGFRPFLLERANFIDALHLSNRDEEYMNIAFIMQPLDGEPRPSRFLRLVDADDKPGATRELMATLRNEAQSENVYTVDQRSFTAIDRSPFIYWFGAELLQLFEDYDGLGDHEDVAIKTGLQTDDDPRFVRCWWEVPPSLLGNRYQWYAMNGDPVDFYHSTEKVIDWENDGATVIEYEDSYPRNPSFYGKAGLTFRYSSSHFIGRDHPDGHIHSHTAHMVTTETRETDRTLLGYLNSSLSRYILDGLNPGLRFEKGDVEKLPSTTIADYPPRLSELASAAIDSRNTWFELVESKVEFEPQTFLNAIGSLPYRQELMEADIATISHQIDTVVFDYYDISPEERSRVTQDFPARHGGYPHVTNVGTIPETNDHRNRVPREEYDSEAYEKLLEEIEVRADDPVNEVASAVEVSPYTVVIARQKHDLYSEEAREDAAARIVSYLLGELFGRWTAIPDLDRVDDGILLFEASQGKGIEARLRDAMELAVEDPYELESRLTRDLGKSPADWLRDTFFRYQHNSDYSRRGQRVPIYWHLESETGAFSCYLYYHAIDADTFPRLRGQYLDARLDQLTQRLDTLQATPSDELEPNERREMETLQDQIDELETFGERLDAVIDSGFDPDFNDGIHENLNTVDEFGVLETPVDSL